MVIFELPGALLIYYVGEAAANVQGERLKAVAVISNGDIELPGALLIYYAGEAVANVQGESLKAAAVICNGDVLNFPAPSLFIMSGRLRRMFRVRA